MQSNDYFMLRLSDLKKGQTGTIVKIDESFHVVQLMEMGFLQGKSVSISQVAPMGDPIAVQISGYLLSIRKVDAAQIWVEV